MISQVTELLFWFTFVHCFAWKGFYSNFMLFELITPITCAELQLRWKRKQFYCSIAPLLHPKCWKCHEKHANFITHQVYSSIWIKLRENSDVLHVLTPRVSKCGEISLKFWRQFNRFGWVCSHCLICFVYFGAYTFEQRKTGWAGTQSWRLKINSEKAKQS